MDVVRWKGETLEFNVDYTSIVDGYFIEFRPFIANCRFPDCTHIHEAGCGVKEAVSQKLISEARYNSYLRLREEDVWVWKNPARGHAK